MSDQQPPIEQAVRTLRELLRRAESRREAERRAEDQARNEALGRMNAEVVMRPGEVAYVSIDGDGIGNRVAQFEERDDEEGLMEVSARINAGQDAMRQWAERHGGRVVEAGGDEGLVRVPAEAVADVESLRDEYRRVVGATATVGVGSTISQSTRARELGKLRGKNQTVRHFDGLEEELQARLEDEGPQDERKKIQAAGLGAPMYHDSGVPKWGVPPEAWDE